MTSKYMRVVVADYIHYFKTLTGKWGLDVTRLQQAVKVGNSNLARLEAYTLVSQQPEARDVLQELVIKLELQT